jgi:hypothetical protein
MFKKLFKTAVGKVAANVRLLRRKEGHKSS